MNNYMSLDLFLLILFSPALLVIIMAVMVLFDIIPTNKKSKKQLRAETVHHLVSSGEYSVAEAWEHAKKEYK